MLSCGVSDGSVNILTVRQTLTSRASLTLFAPDHDVSLSVQEYDVRASGDDGRAITGLRWANIRGRSVSFSSRSIFCRTNITDLTLIVQPILIIHKPGVLHLWSAPSVANTWSGSKAFVLRTQRRSVGSSALSPCSGICYVPSRDMAVVSLSDGSFHVVHKLSTSPTPDPPPSEPIQSEILSAASRSVFVRAEPEKVSLQDVDRINGMVTYDGCSTFMWTYEYVTFALSIARPRICSSCHSRATRPTDFSYKHDAKHVSTFVVAPLWEEDNDERVLVDLAERVGLSHCGLCTHRPLSAPDHIH